MGNLRDKYCVVGIGMTEFSRNSHRTQRAMAVEALHAAMNDAGLGPGDIDGIMSYHGNDSVPGPTVTHDLGIRINYYMDAQGGGSATESLIGTAIGVMEAGMAHTIAVFRSMNGYTFRRYGGRPSPGTKAPPLVITGAGLDTGPYGRNSAATTFHHTFARHMYEYGTTNEQLARVKVAHSKHASNNPRALYRTRVTVDDVLSSRWIVKPACHLLDCCMETDNATCIIITSAERARNLRQRPVYIMAAAGRVTNPWVGDHFQVDPLTRQAGYYGKRILWRNAGVEPKDIQLTGGYDAFTFTPVLLFEAYGFCKPGEGGQYVSSGIIELGGARPNNTSGGQLCEGYTHGMSLVIENVRQLRHQADDSCPRWEQEEHTYDYSEGRCRQVKDVALSANLGWGTPAFGSGMVLRR